MLQVVKSCMLQVCSWDEYRVVSTVRRGGSDAAEGSVQRLCSRAVVSHMVTS